MFDCFLLLVFLIVLWSTYFYLFIFYWNRFPKPTEYYGVLEFFGPNVVTVNGELWKHHRKITSPSFSEQNNLLVHEQTLKHLECMFQVWHKSDSNEAIVNVNEFMIQLTLYIIAGAGFGYYVNILYIDSTYHVNPIYHRKGINYLLLMH